MLPGITGEKLLQEIRKKSKMPVIVLSAKNSMISKIDLLGNGADDYIIKPFDTEEVIARVEAQLRRCYDYGSAVQEQKNVLRHKNLSLDTETHEVKADDQIIILTAKEYAILELLMSHPNKVFTKQNLFESIWRDEYMSDESTINVHISKLRNKLSKTEDYIQTLWGIGYKMCD
ncbi:MAG: response regulator transcription factor, partial [Bacteroidota bacterium]|nr:response regulator transcription factor [Bacteroidota bacterium]